MAIEHRAQLKAAFKTGAIPTESDFGDLIDSALNLDDDGLSVDALKRVMVGTGKPTARLTVQGDFDVPLSGKITVPAPASAGAQVTATGTGTKFATELKAGAKLRINNAEFKVVSIASDVQMTVTASTAVTAADGFSQGDLFSLKDADGVIQFRVDGSGAVVVSGNLMANIDASGITSGTLDAARLPASVTTGALNAGRIPNLDASKITSGTLDAARLPASVTTGAIDASRIPNLDASKITSGTLDAARLPASVTGQVAVSRIQGILTAASGGTGLSAAGVAGNILRSNGNAWESTRLQTADLPNLSLSFIQNTTTVQAATNFNIAGTGKASIFDAGQQFNIGGNCVLTIADNGNLFVGLGADGFKHNTGKEHTFVGLSAGIKNTSGECNTFVGAQNGQENTTGKNNSFFGQNTGPQNTTGSFNTFAGTNAGLSNSTGQGNTFIGEGAGYSNTTGDNNVIVGSSANTGSGILSNATAIGAHAQVTQSNSLILGSISGVNGANSGTKVGIGTTAPSSLLTLKTDAQTDPALEIAQGSLKVTGAGINTGTLAMTLEVNTANLQPGGVAAIIDNPFSNGDPKAILIVTPVSSGTMPLQVFVAYGPTVGKWLLMPFSLGQVSLAVGMRYNVLIIKP